jgi:hypothetical protein
MGTLPRANPPSVRADAHRLDIDRVAIDKSVRR